MHLPVGATTVMASARPACLSTGGASLGLIHVASLREQFLLAYAEDEYCSALDAIDVFVLILFHHIAPFLP
jgi:hypothetical protein